MTEVEKLRALLAEARGLLSKWCWSGTCCELRQRIDAALAEPVSVCTTCDAMSVSYAKMERERDEARAEIERLRGTWKWDAIKAYKRGAEAMRHAAAKEVFAFYGWSKDNETTRTDIKNLAELIDDLPVPEDKP
ncbi:MAG: hypothetical protein KGN78_04925 [Actinomycetales bacterium]|nr:hypothetical protein [Actinomycetales bacterium]